ncbi:MAG: hypothetical protein M3114_00370 [Thermoproteota archaeon]|nr:hypothetical protein [Thermoproteota archaeon]
MKSHIIYTGVADETEVDGALRNSLTIGRGLGMYEELASECVSPVNLNSTK